MASILNVSLLVFSIYFTIWFFTENRLCLFCFKCGLKFEGDWEDSNQDILRYHLDIFAECTYPHLKVAEVVRWRRAHPEIEHFRNDYIRSHTCESYILFG